MRDNIDNSQVFSSFLDFHLEKKIINDSHELQQGGTNAGWNTKRTHQIMNLSQ